MLSALMLKVVMLSVIILSVVAPFSWLTNLVVWDYYIGGTEKIHYLLVKRMDLDGVLARYL